jgi:hypothetical protein
VTVRIGDPIQTAGLKLHDRAAVTEQIRAQIVSLLESAPARMPVPTEPRL